VNKREKERKDEKVYKKKQKTPMGASCNHEHTKVNEVSKECTKAFLWKYKIEMHECLDCKKIFRKELTVGRITGWTYSDGDVNQSDCQHKEYQVDEMTVETVRESTFSGGMLRLFMGAAMDGIQYNQYFVANAKCERCEFKFLVRADRDNKWKDGQVVDTRTSDWKPVKQDVEVDTPKRYKSQYVEVAKK